MQHVVKNSKKALCSLFLSLLAVMFFIGPLATTAKAASDLQEPSQSEIEQASNNLAQALEEVYQADPTVPTEVIANRVVAYAMLDEQTEFSIRSKRSLQSFSSCMLDRMGIGMLRKIGKQIFNTQVMMLLKSHAWKKASAIMVKQITKYASKKLASFAVKKLAGLALPGIGWGSVAWWGVRCGWDEIN